MRAMSQRPLFSFPNPVNGRGGPAVEPKAIGREALLQQNGAALFERLKAAAA